MSNVVDIFGRKPKEKPQDDMSGFCYMCSNCGCKTWYLCADYTCECTGCSSYTTFADILNKPKPGA